MNPATDPETPGETGDPETPPGGKIKPPTGSQPASSQSQVGGKQPPDAATNASEIPIIPPSAAGDPELPGSGDR